MNEFTFDDILELFSRWVIWPKEKGALYVDRVLYTIVWRIKYYGYKKKQFNNIFVVIIIVLLLLMAKLSTLYW